MNILYFAPIYYDDMKQRPQHLAECLARKHTVYYIEPTVSWIRWALKKGRPFQHERKKLSAKLTVIRLSGRFTFHKSVEILDFFGCNSWSEYLQIKKLAERCDLLWTGYSGWYTLLRHFGNKPVVYDRMDEEELLAGPGLLRLTLRRNKKKLVEMSDLLFASCTKFYEEYKDSKPSCLVPNACTAAYVQQGCLHTLPDGKGQKTRNTERIVFGYIGTIGEWFDFNVLRYLLALNEHYDIVLAGRNLMPVFQHPRVTYLGIWPHQRLPELIRSFDVCLYNFKQNELLDTINPVKLYEYLAMQKPVLAVHSKETEALKKYLMIYRQSSEIEKLLAAGLRQPFASQKEYEDFVRQNTWESRTAVIERALDGLMQQRKCTE